MVNDRIRQIRKDKGITQQELILRLIEQGLQYEGRPNIISKIESRKRRVFADEVNPFAKALGVSVQELLQNPEDREPEPAGSLPKHRLKHTG